MNSYPNPCDTCTRDKCPKNCAAWRMRYLYRQKQINAYHVRSYKAKRNMKRQKFVYEHPDLIRRYLQEGPCKKCRAADTCDTPCAAYLRWWDARMEWLKGRLRL